MLDWNDLVNHLHYDQITGNFIWKKITSNRVTVGRVAGNPSNAHGNYWEIGFRGRTYPAHRLAWFYVHKRFPEKLIDHIDGNPSNNAISNLRCADDVLNGQNRHKSNSNNKSGWLGVCYDNRRKKYRATIRHSGKNFHVGYFKTETEAHAAYLSEKRKHHEGCTI